MKASDSGAGFIGYATMLTPIIIRYLKLRSSPKRVDGQIVTILGAKKNK